MEQIFSGLLKLAYISLGEGDPEAAFNYMEQALQHEGRLEERKLIEKAKDEAECGDPAKAETLLEMAAMNLGIQLQEPDVEEMGQKKVVIVVRGGCVVQALTNDPKIEVELLDFDNQDDIEERNRIEARLKEVESDSTFGEVVI